MKKITKILLLGCSVVLCSCATNRKVALEHKEIENDTIQILKWTPPIKIENDTVKYLR